MAHEERLPVVGGVHPPRRHAVGPAAAHRDVGLTEDGEQVAGAGLLEILAHQQVGVHPHEQHLDPARAARPGDLGEAVLAGLDGDPVVLGDAQGVGVEGGPEHAQQVDVGHRDRLTDGLDVAPGVGVEAGELDAFGTATVLHPRSREVVEDRLLERGGSRLQRGAVLADGLSLRVHRIGGRGGRERQRAVRRQALDRERPGDADGALVLVGPAPRLDGAADVVDELVDLAPLAGGVQVEGLLHVPGGPALAHRRHRHPRLAAPPARQHAPAGPVGEDLEVTFRRVEGAVQDRVRELSGHRRIHLRCQTSQRVVRR